mmetsp:Transcript_38213/g.57194  ORF Transcript_38213/g.57194 Transcript_38213/m.57194 type:complete len:123 (+) Transcript_38213:796-1164(+)
MASSFIDQFLLSVNVNHPSICHHENEATGVNVVHEPTQDVQSLGAIIIPAGALNFCSVPQISIVDWMFPGDIFVAAYKVFAGGSESKLLHHQTTFAGRPTISHIPPIGRGAQSSSVRRVIER